MHKKTKKKIFITALMVIFILLFISNTFVKALDPISIATEPDGTTGVGELNKLGNAILGIIQYIGLGVAVIATLVLAMKYMYSSPEDKATIKKKLIPFIIGGFMVFGAIQLVKIVETFTKEII